MWVLLYGKLDLNESSLRFFFPFFFLPHFLFLLFSLAIGRLKTILLYIAMHFDIQFLVCEGR